MCARMLHVCVCVCVCVCVSDCVFVYMYVYVEASMCVCVYVRIHIYTYIIHTSYIHTCIHVFMYLYISRRCLLRNLLPPACTSYVTSSYILCHIIIASALPARVLRVLVIILNININMK